MCIFKSHFGHSIQLAVDVSIPEELGGAGGEAVYIDTEGSFIIERVVDIAKATADHCRRMALRVEGHYAGMGIVCKNTNFQGSDPPLTFHREKIVRGGNKSVVQKKKKKRKHWFWFCTKYLRNIQSGMLDLRVFLSDQFPCLIMLLMLFTGLLLKYRETFIYLLKIKCFCCGFFWGRGR